MGCRGSECSTMGLSWAAGNFCSTPGTPPALLRTDLSVIRAVSLTFSHSPLPTTIVQQLFLHLAPPEVHLASITGSALASGSSLLRTRDSCWALFTEDTCSAFPSHSTPASQLMDWKMENEILSLQNFKRMLSFSWSQDFSLCSEMKSQSNCCREVRRLYYCLH